MEEVMGFGNGQKVLSCIDPNNNFFKGKWGWVKVEFAGNGDVLMDVYAGRKSGLKDKLICHFNLVADMVEVEK